MLFYFVLLPRWSPNSPPIISDVPLNNSLPALLQGRWRVLSWYDGGREAPHELRDNAELLVDSETLQLTVGNRTMIPAMRYTIDSSKNPKWIDLKPAEAQADRGLGFDRLGIYELQGDRLRICFSEMRGIRATEFASHPKSPSDLYIVCSRVK